MVQEKTEGGPIDSMAFTSVQKIVGLSTERFWCRTTESFPKTLPVYEECKNDFFIRAYQPVYPDSYPH